MADIDIDLENGAARVCKQCGGRIDEARLDSHLRHLRDLDAVDFYVCTDCVTVKNNTCRYCTGAVFVPRQQNEDTEAPHICPACRNDVIEETGEDPGWYPAD